MFSIYKVYRRLKRGLSRCKKINNTLAHVGIIFIKEEDIMEHFACGVRVRQWKTSDILAVEHKKWSSVCIYLKLSG